MQSKGVYEEGDITARLRQDLPNWRYEVGQLRRTYRTHGFKASVLVANAVAHLAEAAWHHPDITISFGRVEVAIESHDVGGITDRDFELAGKIEQVVAWQPSKEGGALTGTPAGESLAKYIKYDA
ncbi:MAG: 4a-hydroxytetrahydrobiopterin dehydratase [Dichotomicrobium sp.]